MHIDLSGKRALVVGGGTVGEGNGIGRAICCAFASCGAEVIVADQNKEAAQKTGMSEKDLRSVNDIPPNMMIKAGSTLLVPRSASSQSEVTSQVADNGRVSLTPEEVTRRTLIKAGRRDSVTSIARRYHVTTADVATWNDVKSGSSFSPGSSVVLYLPVRMSSRSTSGPSSSRSSAGKRAAGKTATHSRGGKASKVRRK